jgi:hypothetical protein
MYAPGVDVMIAALVCAAALAAWLVVQVRIDRQGRRDHELGRLAAKRQDEQAAHERLMEQTRLEHKQAVELRTLEGPHGDRRTMLALEARRDEAATAAVKAECERARLRGYVY